MKRLLIELFVPALLGPSLLLAVDLWHAPGSHPLQECAFLLVAVPLLLGPGLIASVPYTVVMELAFFSGVSPGSHESQALSILLGAGAAVAVSYLFGNFGSGPGAVHFDLMKSLPQAGVGGAVGFLTGWLVQGVSRPK